MYEQLVWWVSHQDEGDLEGKTKLIKGYCQIGNSSVFHRKNRLYALLLERFFGYDQGERGDKKGETWTIYSTKPVF